MGAGLSLFAVRRPELIVRLAPTPWSATPTVIGPGPLPCLPNLHIRDSRERSSRSVSVREPPTATWQRIGMPSRNCFLKRGYGLLPTMFSTKVC
jgi:hypothetical protein